MTAIALDTLSVARRLREKGWPQEQAEAIADELRMLRRSKTTDLATREDLAGECTVRRSGMQAEFARVRSETQSEFALVRSQIRWLDSRLECKFKDMQLRLGGMIVALGGILIAIKHFR